MTGVLKRHSSILRTLGEASGKYLKERTMSRMLLKYWMSVELSHQRMMRKKMSTTQRKIKRRRNKIFLTSTTCLKIKEITL